MIRKLSRNILSALVVACLLALATATAVVTTTATTARAAEKTTLRYDFTDAAQLNDFIPVYAAEEGDGSGKREEFAAHWVHTAAAGKVTSQRDDASVNAGQGSNNAKGWTNPAQLVLARYRFTNFEAEIELNYAASGSTDGWGGLHFRKSSLLSGGRKGGCYAFVQAEGHATLWGDGPFVYESGGNREEMKESKCTDPDFKSIYRYRPFMLKVRAVGRSCDVTVRSIDGSVTYATAHVDYETDDAVRSGFVSLQSGDEYIDYTAFRITNLDAQGNPAPLVDADTPTSIAFDKSKTNYEVGEHVALKATVQPSTAAANVLWSVSDGDVAVVRGGSVYGIAAGDVTVTAASVFDAKVTDSITLHFAEPKETKYRYTFADAASLDPFTAAFAVEKDGGLEEASAHWQVQEGHLRRTGLPENDNDSARNMAFLYIDDLVATNFAATLVYRVAVDEYGWIGVTSGTMAYGKRCLDEGLGMFVQREGQPTIWGKETGKPIEAAANGYAPSDWHVLHVKAYGGKAEVYLDDLLTPALTANMPIVAGHVGFFTTCKANYEIKSFAFSYLDESGNVSDISSVQSIAIDNKISTAKAGDSFALSVTPTPAVSTPLEYEWSVSDNSVAFVRDGVLRFTAAGEVTVTAVCKFDRRLTDSMTVTVTAKNAGGGDKPNEEEGNKGGKKGCGSAASAACGGAAAILIGIGAALCKKNRAQGR